jgi:hypothetical protein
MSMPLGVFYCPSRRSTIAYPWTDWDLANARPRPASVGHCDYACNGGDFYTDPDSPTAAAWVSIYGCAGPNNVTEVESPQGGMTSQARTTFNQVAAFASGIIYCGSMIKVGDVTDGSSKTFLLGEKYLNPDSYFTGVDGSDNGPALQGDNADVARWSGWRPDSPWPPTQDTPGLVIYSFGSAHATGCFMAFCDGSAQLIAYSINTEVHRRLANRKDDQAVDPKAL